MFFPILVVVVGVIWLLTSMGVVSTDVWSYVLPVAVILAGISMLTKKCGCCNTKKCDSKKDQQNN